MTRDSSHPVAREGHVPVGSAGLFYRDIGHGAPIVVLHGGPEFDHGYLLPEMDRLADSFRLIYYDQRGRGRSADGVHPEDVGIESDVEDLESLRRWFELDSIIVLGHSWGGVLAMEYTVRHPKHVSRLVLINTAPASHPDVQLLRDHFRNIRPAGDAERMASLRATTAFVDGDLEVEAEYYRIHYGLALPRPEHVERVVGRLRTNVTSEGVLKARAIEERLYEQTWSLPDYDLVSQLSRLDTPTLVIHGDKDFVPVELAARIADAMPRGRLIVIPGCGHFAYLEFTDLIHTHITSFVQAN